MQCEYVKNTAKQKIKPEKKDSYERQGSCGQLVGALVRKVKEESSVLKQQYFPPEISQKKQVRQQVVHTAPNRKDAEKSHRNTDFIGRPKYYFLNFRSAARKSCRSFGSGAVNNIRARVTGCSISSFHACSAGRFCKGSSAAGSRSSICQG
jgi:hypothetical protein